MESVRPATKQDAEACGELCEHALAEISGVRGGPLFARRETGILAKALLRPGGLDRILYDRQRLVVVGLIDDLVVGLAVARSEPVGETNLGVIEAYYVERDARGVGVGAAMLESVISWLGTKGCRAVDAQALPGDRRMKSFFEAAGFKARLITMHKELT
jgi:GNAT superfamily N-acetyltransferase